MTAHENPLHDIVAMHARLKARIAHDGRRTIIDTIPPDPVRSARSRRTCHLPAELKPIIVWHPDNGRFTPQLAAAIDDDPNLTDGARRCARKIAEYTYRNNRDKRECRITVGYLALGLRRCCRTIQRYLRQLERAGYIQVDVLVSPLSALCVGLGVKLLRPFFPKHHAQKWPSAPMIPAPTPLSQNHDSKVKYIRYPLNGWAYYCCEAIHRAYMKTLPPPPPLL